MMGSSRLSSGRYLPLIALIRIIFLSSSCSHGFVVRCPTSFGIRISTSLCGDSSDATDTTSTTSFASISVELEDARTAALEALERATSVREAEDVRVKYLGKKGIVASAMGYMRSLPPADKPKLGSVVNVVKDTLESAVVSRKSALEIEEVNVQLEKERIDVTMPGLPNLTPGKRHPLSMTIEKACEVFVSLGYDTVTALEDSPEIETDYYCFEALNCPKDHPARDMQDTFYLTEDMETLLRTQTSAVQIRQMETRKPPFRIVSPGRVYRKDDIDATHSLIFHQVEILAIEKRGELTLGHLKGTVEYFLQQMFGPDIDVRFRGSYFPFTEPSMEVDVFFRGKWLEVLGCGMVDPNVLEMAGIDPMEYSGFAAGFGAERFAMVIHGVTDIREFYNSDNRFISQFPHFHDDGMISHLVGGNREERKKAMNALGIETTESDMPFTSLTEVADGSTSTALTRDQSDPKPGKEKKKKKKKSTSSDAVVADIDISKLDIRVGKIIKVWDHPDSDKLFCEEIDLGEEDGPRQILSGLRAHYSAADLEDRKVLVLANLKVRKLAGLESKGMVLCAASEGGEKVVFLDVPKGAEVGERVTFKGYEGEPATPNQIIKKKLLDKIFPHFVTDKNGVPTYKGVTMETIAGLCTSSLPNCEIS